MPRFGRLIFNATTVVSLALGVVVLLLGMWGHSRWAEWSSANQNNTRVFGVTFTGDRLLLASYISAQYPLDKQAWGSPGFTIHNQGYDPAPDLGNAPLLLPPNRKFRIAGIVYTRRGDEGGGFHYLLLPLWSINATLFVLPAFWLWRRFRPTRPPGCCNKCGYNLTGNISGVCPECGTPPPAPN